MKSSLSTICQQAKIIDLENDVVHSYAELFATNTGGQVTSSMTSLEYRAALRSKQPAHRVARSYLFVWSYDMASHVTSRKAPHQFTPDEVETQYHQTTHIKPRKLAKGR